MSEDSAGAIHQVSHLAKKYWKLTVLTIVYILSVSVYQEVLGLPTSIEWVLTVPGVYASIGAISAAEDGREPSDTVILAIGAVFGVLAATAAIVFDPSVAIQQNCGGALCL